MTAAHDTASIEHDLTLEETVAHRAESRAAGAIRLAVRRASIRREEISSSSATARVGYPRSSHGRARVLRRVLASGIVIGALVVGATTALAGAAKQRLDNELISFTESAGSGTNGPDGGESWTNVHPPHGSYRFLTDPALAFDTDGHLYWSNVASHDSVAGAFSDVSVIVERSDDGGITWTDPVTVAAGNGTISNGGSNVQFNDKDWIAVDRGTSGYSGSVYVTWARQEYRKDVQTESPIFFLRSRDGGATGTSRPERSGSSPLCSGQGATGPTTRCDQNDAGFSSPIVAPDGTVYVAFLNHQAQGGTLRDQVLIVSSTDAGDHWSPPRQVVGL